MAAMVNPKITAQVIECTEFPDLSDSYNISAVPVTSVESKQKLQFVGKYPEPRFIEELLKAVQ